MARTRELTESPFAQGADEKIAYWVDVSTWSDTPITPTAALYDITTGARVDVTSTSMTGSATLAGTIFTAPYVYALTSGNVYRGEGKFYDGANVFEFFFIINAED